MPEFHLDHGTPEGAKAFAALDSFTQGYIEAMFFTDASSADDGDDLDGATFAELAPAALIKIITDCAAFQRDCEALLNDVYGVQGHHEREPYDDTKAGRDYWYSRNGHGTGFWDRGLGVFGDELHNAARSSSVDLYRGDDGRLYLS